MLMAITITPRARGIGAEVGGIDLGKPLPDKSFEALRSAFEAYRLLIFRNLRWTVDQQVAYSEKFGALEDFPDPKDQSGRPQDRAPRHQYRPRDEHHKTGRRSWTQIIHTRNIGAAYRLLRFATLPSKASVLYALEMPEDGGDTMFAGYNPDLRSLSEDRKRALENLVIVHDFEETRRQGTSCHPGHLRCKPQPRRRGSHRSSPSAPTDAAPCSSVPTQRVSRA